MNTADGVLLRRWVTRRDPEAFGEIVSRHSGMVFGVCRRMLRDGSAAQDVTQECFVRLLQSPAQPGTCLAAWLHTVATRRCLDVLRSERRRRAREERYAAEAASSTELPWEAIESVVDEAIAELPERLREPVVAHYLEGLTHEAIAVRLGVARRTVSHRIQAGLERLGKSLRERGFAVSAGVMGAQLSEKAIQQAPAELIARLAKLALAQAAQEPPVAHRAMPGKPWAAAGVLTAALIVAGLFGAKQMLDRRIVAALPPTVASVETAEAPRSRLPETASAGVQEAVEEASAVNSLDSLAEPESGEEAPPPLACAVSGIVLDEDGYAVNGASVFVAPRFGYITGAVGEARAATTSGAGEFGVEGIPFDGPGVVKVNAEGYDHAARDVVLERGKRAEGLRFVLSRGVTLRGRVIGRDGIPVSGGTVIECAFEGRSNRGTGGSDFSLVGEDGSFALGFPEAGTAVVKATTEQSGEGVFQVAVEAGGFVELRMPVPARLEGRVLRADGKPAADVKVAVTGQYGESGVPTRYQSPTDSEGNYTVNGIAPDLGYVAEVQDESSVALAREADLGVLTAGTVLHRDFRLEAPIRVRGRVIGEQTGKPQPNARVSWTRGAESRDGAVQTNAGGAYELTLYEPGSYFVYAMPGNGVITGEFIEAHGRTVHVGAGDEKVEDFLIPDGFSLGVRVLDGRGRPIGGAEVRPHFSDRPGSSSSFAMGQTDAAGRFRWEGFHPGLESWLEVGLAGGGGSVAATTPVVGEPGVDYLEETVVLYGSGGLMGTALGPDGRPLAGVRITVHVLHSRLDIDGMRAGNVDASFGTQTDAAGVFVLAEGVPAAPLEVTVKAKPEKGPELSAGLRAECAAGQIADLGPVTLDRAIPD